MHGGGGELRGLGFSAGAASSAKFLNSYSTFDRTSSGGGAFAFGELGGALAGRWLTSSASAKLEIVAMRISSAKRKSSRDWRLGGSGADRGKRACVGCIGASSSVGVLAAAAGEPSSDTVSKNFSASCDAIVSRNAFANQCCALSQWVCAHVCSYYTSSLYD